MTLDNNSQNIQLCSTCGTRLSADSTRCLVCGSEIEQGPEKHSKSTRTLQGSRMPRISLSLPGAVVLFALFLFVGAALVYFALQRESGVEKPTITPTITLTLTPSLTPTPQTPTATPSPLPSPTPFTYVVASGDTCSGIAAAFGVSVQSIVLLNNLPAACNTLLPGNGLLIPYPTPTTTALPSATLSGIDATLAACDTVNYTVQEGDTLSDISANYDVPMEAIKDFNGMVNNVVYQGLTLLVPLCERAATPGPTPTPTKAPPYPAPNLLLPPDGASFSALDEIITLQWAVVGTLNTNESYAVAVEDVTEGEGRKLEMYVKDSKYILPLSFRSTDTFPHIYRWWIVTVRQAGTDDNGNSIWESAGAESLKRNFIWTSDIIPSTPTP